MAWIASETSSPGLATELEYEMAHLNFLTEIFRDGEAVLDVEHMAYKARLLVHGARTNIECPLGLSCSQVRSPQNNRGLSIEESSPLGEAAGLGSKAALLETRCSPFATLLLILARCDTRRKRAHSWTSFEYRSQIA